MRQHFTGAFYHWMLGLQEAWSAVSQALGPEVPSTLPCLPLYKNASVCKGLYFGVYRPHKEQLEAEARAREAAHRARQLAAQQQASAAAQAAAGGGATPGGSGSATPAASQQAGGAVALAKHRSPGPQPPGGAADGAAAALAAAARAGFESALRGYAPGQPLSAPQLDAILAAVACGMSVAAPVAAAALAALVAAKREGREFARATPDVTAALITMARPAETAAAAAAAAAAAWGGSPKVPPRQ